MEELTKKEEEFILEEQKRDTINEYLDGQYNEWLNLNESSIRDEFISNNLEEFKAFCKQIYQEEKGG